MTTKTETTNDEIRFEAIQIVLSMMHLLKKTDFIKLMKTASSLFVQSWKREDSEPQKSLLQYLLESVLRNDEIDEFIYRLEVEPMIEKIYLNYPEVPSFIKSQFIKRIRTDRPTIDEIRKEWHSVLGKLNVESDIKI